MNVYLEEICFVLIYPGNGTEKNQTRAGWNRMIFEFSNKTPGFDMHSLEAVFRSLADNVAGWQRWYNDQLQTMQPEKRVIFSLWVITTDFCNPAERWWLPTPPGDTDGLFHPTPP